MDEYNVSSSVHIRWLCGKLRTIGRADAAQKLELLTDLQWMDCGANFTGECFPQPSIYPHRLLYQFFDWDRSPEGTEYWFCLYRALRERFSHPR